ncbi:MAG: CvpA family protein [Synergistaceae bacterium]|jgi:membrane protein required for colicin V production|nr:CvpA family protein [Synergistaceae bacterium]
MNIVDMAFLLIGAFLIVRGAFRGASGEIFSLLSVVGGFYCATAFYAPAARMLSERLGLNHLIATGLSMIAIFLIVSLVCAAADKIIKKILNVSRLSLADKLGGAAVGLVKMYVLALLALVAGMIISPVTGGTWISGSKTLTATARTWPFVSPALNSLGLLPDLALLKDEARGYVIKQAAGSLYGPETNFGSLLPASSDITSRDIEELQSALSRDFPISSSKNQMLNFFLKWDD